ncbi:MAG TPA: carboxymuconolactone decarboxylase family protein [Baekduia sp.]|nr:carboxymuconolactone decarboxylase family protein [Baekduia sp.]
MDDERDLYEVGADIRRAVLGGEYVEKAAAQPGDVHEAFQRFMIEYCWGGCWGRDALPRPTRSLLVLAILGSLGRWDEFDLHVRGAIRNGCSTEEIADTLFHVAIYAGVPVGVSAFKHLRQVLAETEAT